MGGCFGESGTRQDAEISHVPQDVEISPVPQEDPSEAHPLEQLEISLPKRGEVEVKEQEKHSMLNEIQKIFVSRATNVCLHNYYECAETIATKLSEKEVSRFTSSCSRDRFVHGWLADKSISFCKTTGLYWLVYEEGQGMYCFLCRKHNTENAKNKSKAYNSTPSVHFKKSAIKDHLLSHQHKDVVEAEMLSSVAVSQGSYREREGEGCSLNECFPGCLLAS